MPHRVELVEQYGRLTLRCVACDRRVVPAPGSSLTAEVADFLRHGPCRAAHLRELRMPMRRLPLTRAPLT